MADKTINQLTEDTSPTGDDFIPSWDTTSGAAKKVQLQNLKTYTSAANNPYKFRVYRNAAANTSAGAFIVVNFDTKVFDTGSNVDVVTNKGRFTAPIAGFYHFNSACHMSSSSSEAVLSLYKNGAEISRGTRDKANAAILGVSVGDTLQLAANDYVEVFAYNSSTLALDIGAITNNWFSGFLMSAT